MRQMIPCFRFARGSTPTLAFRLPVRLSREEDRFNVTFWQDGGTVLELSERDARLVTDGQMLYAELTQADTLRFAAGPARVQVRYRLADGTADVSEQQFGMVGHTQKEGELT